MKSMIKAPKNLIVYMLNKPFEHTQEQLCAAFSEYEFKPCGSNDISKFGFVPVINGESGDLVHAAGGHMAYRVRKEEKIIPSDYVKRMMAEQIDSIEATEGRKIYKKERDSIKDDVINQLLSRAMTKTTDVIVYHIGDMIAVATSSASAAEYALALIRKSVGSLPVVPVSSVEHFQISMSNHVVEGELPVGFKFGQKIILADSYGAKATFSNLDVSEDEIIAHINNGMSVKSIQLGMDGLGSFTVTDSLSFKSIKFDVELFDDNDDIEDEKAKADADHIIICDSIIKMISGTFDGFLGGIYK